MLTTSGYRGRMGGIARIGHGFGRRQPRLLVGMPARVLTLERTIAVVIEDLSADGARIALPASDAFVACVLRWMDYQAFAEVVWRKELSVGLRFDRPLSAGTLEATGHYAREAATLAPRSKERLRRC